MHTWNYSSPDPCTSLTRTSVLLGCPRGTRSTQCASGCAGREEWIEENQRWDPAPAPVGWLPHQTLCPTPRCTDPVHMAVHEVAHDRERTGHRQRNQVVGDAALQQAGPLDTPLKAAGITCAAAERGQHYPFESFGQREQRGEQCEAKNKNRIRRPACCLQLV